jgi:hypothetical protein
MGRLSDGLVMLDISAPADEVADELAGRGVRAALDSGLDGGAGGLGERNDHAGLRHRLMMALLDIIYYGL